MESVIFLLYGVKSLSNTSRLHVRQRLTLCVA